MEPTIKHIEYRFGMLERRMKPAKLPVRRWKWEEVPQKIRQAIMENKVWELPGSYGNPLAGEPVEYHHLRIIHDTGAVGIEFFNLAITVFMTDDEDIKRIFRALIQCRLAC